MIEWLKKKIRNKKDTIEERRTKFKDAVALTTFMTKVVIFCIAFITIYTIVAIILQIQGIVLSDTLTDRVFTCLIGELCITGLLKITSNVLEALKHNKGYNGNGSENISEDEKEEYNTMVDNIIQDIKYSMPNGNGSFISDLNDYTNYIDEH